jgi:hypothetical protein
MINNSKFKKINTDLLENLKTISQLVEGYNETKLIGTKEDVLFYSDLIIDSYLRVSQLFVELHLEVENKNK